MPPLNENYDIGNSQGRTRIKQSGERTVRHVGGRLVGVGSKALVVTPVFPGESLRSMQLDCYASSDSNVQPDSPMQIEWLALFQPFDFISNITAASLSNSSYDAFVGQLIGGAGTNQQYGGDPDNKTGREAFEAPQLGMRTQELLWQREDVMTVRGQMTSHFNVGEVLNSHPQSGPFTAKIGKNFYFPYAGMVIVGVNRYDLSAETNFAFNLFEAGFDEENWAKVLGANRADYSGLSSVEQQAIEFVYGGDTFIEADTWKTDDVRAHVLAQFRFGTPYPEGDYVGAETK